MTDSHPASPPRLAARIAELEARNRELAERNRELDEFATIVSHDLREPLRGLRICSRILIEDHDEAIGERGREAIEQLVRLSRRLEARVEAVLEYARSGCSSVRPQPVDAAEALETALALLDPRIRERRIEIRRGPPPPLLLIPEADLIEILVNLIGNAVKYNDKEAAWMEAGCAPDHPDGDMGFAVLYVRDNGVGIDARDHEAVFEMFRRLKGRGATADEGAGVGLAIVRKLVRRQGGEAWVDSSPGDGTTFYFTAPRAPEPERV